MSTARPITTAPAIPRIKQPRPPCPTCRTSGIDPVDNKKCSTCHGIGELPHRFIPNTLAILIDRHAESWHSYRRASEDYVEKARINHQKARDALDLELQKVINEH